MSVDPLRRVAKRLEEANIPIPLGLQDAILNSPPGMPLQLRSPTMPTPLPPTPPTPLPPLFSAPLEPMHALARTPQPAQEDPPVYCGDLQLGQRVSVYIAETRTTEPATILAFTDEVGKPIGVIFDRPIPNSHSCDNLGEHGRCRWVTRGEISC